MTPIFIPIVTNSNSGSGGDITISKSYLVVAVVMFFIFFFITLKDAEKEWGDVEADSFVLFFFMSVLAALLWPLTGFISALWFAYKKYIRKD